MGQKTFISHLPKDLLEKIFHYLDVRSQCAVRQTCGKWHRIISEDGFIRNMRMVLNIYNLCPEDRLLITRLKKYRSFTLRDSLNNAEYVKLLRYFLYDEEVAERVEELKLDMLHYTLLDVFSGAGFRVHMPKLTKLIILPRVSQSPEYFLNFCLDAPNLKYAEFRDAAYTLVPVVRIMRGQFEHIVLKQMDMEEAIPLISRERFDYLRSLTMIKDGPDVWRREKKFTGEDGLLLGLIRHLQLISNGDYFTQVMPLLFQHTHYVISLHVEGSIISEKALKELEKMPMLEELTLISHIEGLSEIAPLSYRELTRLTVSQQLLPLRNAPNLKWIRVVNNTQREDQYISNNAAAEELFAAVRQNLETLIIDGIHIHSTTADQICQLTNLRKLRITKAKLNFYWQKRIELVHRERVRFINCYNVAELLREPPLQDSDIIDDGEKTGLDESILEERLVCECAAINVA